MLSLTFIGNYWNNHHHLLRATRRISGGVMWADLHLLFWLWLVPVVTAWVEAHPLSTLPTATYGAIGLLAGGSILSADAGHPRREQRYASARAVRERYQGQAVSPALYTLGIALAVIEPLLAYGAY
ncbi:MAG TPA: TMEM175 family protein, partial [Ktedonobacterales bacterium]|nr:TMEM175 family protein [Ktedonobacterales bacterium]